MSQQACQWILLQSLNDKVKRVCGDPADGESRYRPAHPKELLSFIAHENAEKQYQE
jgi:hypothetical protein